jgi:hypothetical protein
VTVRLETPLCWIDGRPYEQHAWRKRKGECACVRCGFTRGPKVAAARRSTPRVFWPLTQVRSGYVPQNVAISILGCDRRRL